MELQRRPRWKNTAGLQFNRDNTKEVLMVVFNAVIFDVLCALFFLYSSFQMVGMVYNLRAYSPGFFMRAFCVLAVVSLVFHVTGCMRKLPAVLLQCVIAVCGIWGVLYYVFKEENLSKLISGFWYISGYYVEAWNVYFGTDLSCPKGNVVHGMFFLEVILLAAILLFFWLAKLSEKNNSMAVVPLLLFCAGLVVGAEPTGKGIALLLCGILLSCNQWAVSPDFMPSEDKKGKRAGWMAYYSWVMSALVTGVICVGVFLTGKEDAEQTVAEYAGEAEDFVLDTANAIAVWDIWRKIEDPGGVEDKVQELLGITEYNYTLLSNRPLVFENIPVLHVTMEDRPQTLLYLKGFYADLYNNGVWERNLSGYEAFCHRRELDPKEVAEQLGTLGIEKVKRTYNAEKLSGHSNGVEFNISYYESDTVKAYLPYFIEESMEGVTVDNEGLYKKRLSDKEMSGTVWKYAGSYDTLLGSFAQGIPYSWENSYEEYVMRQYLTVPEHMTNVEKVAAELADADLNRTKLGTITSENEERLARAFWVADWMARNTTYSQNPPELPWREDPIEFFLGEGRSGYCMHYASASVMILRKLGVPARYASGYVAEGSSFASSEKGFATEVLDNQAHAWAEVYLDGIGWVPVEVTAGYSTLIPTPTPTPLPTNTPTPSPTPTNTPTPTPTNTPTPIPTMNPQGTITPVLSEGAAGPSEGPGASSPGEIVVPNGDTEQPVTPSGIPTPTNTPTPTPSPTPVPHNSGLGNGTNTSDIEGVKGENDQNEESPKVPSGMKEKDIKTIVGKCMLATSATIMISLLLLAPAAVVDHFFRTEKITHRRIVREMDRKGNTRAIKMLSRAIYRKLNFKGMVKDDCTDYELEVTLRNNFTTVWPQDWDRYMELVKAAEFSLREFTDEEVMFCYRIYRDVIY